jgi:hypothetical protein
MPDSFPLLDWPAFNGKIEQIQRLCQNNSEKLTPPPESVALLQALHQSLQAQMTDGSGKFSLPISAQRHITELHRLLRLSLTDAALCRTAVRSPVSIAPTRRGDPYGDFGTLEKHARHGLLRHLSSHTDRRCVIVAIFGIG